MLTASADEAMQVSEVIPKELAKLKVDCHSLTSDKCRTFGKDDSIDFVGLKLTRTGKVCPSNKALENLTDRFALNFVPNADLISSVTATRRYSQFWRAYYSQTDISQGVLQTLETRARTKLEVMLKESTYGSGGISKQSVSRIMELIGPIVNVQVDVVIKERMDRAVEQADFGFDFAEEDATEASDALIERLALG